MTCQRRTVAGQLTSPDVYPFAMLGSSPEYSDSPDACPATHEEVLLQFGRGVYMFLHARPVLQTTVRPKIAQVQ